VNRLVDLASWRPDATPDAVGIPIIDNLDDLHPGALHTMALMNAIIVRRARR
jgi:hypothetical protein